jgi:hypothetical protein
MDVPRPIGYINVPRAYGKSLIPDPERAPIVRRVFQEYATGRFTKQQVLEQARAWPPKSSAYVSSDWDAAAKSPLRRHR